jgi:hypothetical protein
MPTVTSCGQLISVMISQSVDRSLRPMTPFSAGARAFGLYPSKPMANARSEMYFTLEHSLRHGGLELIDHKGLHQELASTRIKTDYTNGYQLEDKKSVASRLGRSPDKADATALAVYGSVLNE